MIHFSQRDWRWSWKRIGTSFSTIGQVGCTITCLSMITGQRPDVTNTFLTKGGGYIYGNIINWTKLHDCLGLTFNTRMNGYDNLQVLNAISQYGFCLVQVDAAPIGNPGGKHWVVFVGNHQLLDPWTGTARSTSVYIPTGFCVISK